MIVTDPGSSSGIVHQDPGPADSRPPQICGGREYPRRALGIPTPAKAAPSPRDPDPPGFAGVRYGQFGSHAGGDLAGSDQAQDCLTPTNLWGSGESPPGLNLPDPESNTLGFPAINVQMFFTNKLAVRDSGYIGLV